MNDFDLDEASHYTPDEQAALDAFRVEQEEYDPEAAQWQTLIDRGIWGLEGYTGREMMRMIDGGRCILSPLAPARDYWGNRIPAEYEVKDDTKGSLQYALRVGENVRAAGRREEGLTR